MKEIRKTSQFKKDYKRFKNNKEFVETLMWIVMLLADIPNPYGRDLGLGYRVRTLPLGRDRWGRYSTKGGYIPAS